MTTTYSRGELGYRNALLAMLAAGVSTFMVMYFTQALLPAFSAAFHLTPSRASLSVSLTTLFLAISIVPMSLLSQKYGKYQILRFSIVSVSVTTLLLAFAPNFTLFLIGRAVQGVLLAGIPAVAIAYVAVVISPQSSATAMGVYIAGTSMGGLLGRVIAGVSSEWLPWQGSTLLIGVLALISAAMFIRFAPRPQRHGKKLHWGLELRVLIAQIMNPALLALFTIGFLLMGSFVSVYNYLGFYLMGPEFGLSPKVTSLLFFTYLIGLVVPVQAAKLSTKYGKGKTLAFILALGILGIWGTLSPYLIGLGLGLLFFTAAFFGGHAIVSHWVTQLARHRQTEASALYLLFYYLGSGIVGTATGVVYQYSNWVGVVVVLTMLLILAVGAVAVVSRRAS